MATWLHRRRHYTNFITFIQAEKELVESVAEWSWELGLGCVLIKYKASFADMCFFKINFVDAI